MKLNNTLFTGALLLATLFTGSAQAATYDVVNHGETQYVLSDFSGSSTSDVDTLNMVADGLVTFEHAVVTPIRADQLMSYTLQKGADIVTFSLASLGNTFSTFLTKGLWTMTVVNLDNTTPAAGAGTTQRR